MPTFTTPRPINVTLELDAADVKILASDRTDTVVEVRARGKIFGAKAAELTCVDYSSGRLLIKGMGPRNLFNSVRRAPVDVTIELPAGSNVQAKGMDDFRAEGRLGDCQIKTAGGNISLDRCGALTLMTVSGDITVNHGEGPVNVTTGSGFVRIQKIDGAAMIKHANGDISIGEMTGELQLSVAKGDINFGLISGSAVAKTAMGDIRVNEVARGSIQLESAYGDLEIGMPEGTAAWLDVSTQHGIVRNSLKAGADSGQLNKAEVRAHTLFGDIAIRRSN